MSKFCSQPFGANLLIILIRNFMLINDHIKIWVSKSKKLKLLLLKFLIDYHKERHIEHLNALSWRNKYIGKKEKEVKICSFIFGNFDNCPLV